MSSKRSRSGGGAGAGRRKSARRSGRSRGKSARAVVTEEGRLRALQARLDALEDDNYVEEVDTRDLAYVDDHDGDEAVVAAGPSRKKSSSKGGGGRKQRRAAAEAAEAVLSNAGVLERVFKPRPLAELVYEESASFEEGTPNYYNCNSRPSVQPPRHWCSVCGFAAPYTCVACGSRFCSLRCRYTHDESRCVNSQLY